MARSPLVVDVAPLNRQPGRQHHFELSLDPPADLTLASANVRAEQLHLDLMLEVAGAELIASGAITVDWVGPCRRCLEDQQGSTRIATREIFQHEPIDGETYPLAEDQVDLEPMVRETVLLHLPVAPLCSPDCAGPDPDRFPTAVADEAGPVESAEAPRDPRWAALGDIEFD